MQTYRYMMTIASSLDPQALFGLTAFFVFSQMTIQISNSLANLKADCQLAWGCRIH